MFNLSNLKPMPGSKTARKRVGRGPGSDLGKTAGKGHKGQKARVGASIPAGFEGGQMPLYRRLPKRGFKNPFRKEYAIINLAGLGGAKAGEIIDRQWLAENGILPKALGSGVKLLGQGDIKVAVTIKVEKVSATAQKKIEAAGGKVELV